MRLDGRVAIVTGAAGGLGRAIAQALHAHGASVLLSDRDGVSLEETALELGLPARACDVTDGAQVQAMVAHCGGSLGEPDVLVHCAGATFGCDFLQLDEQRWRRMLEVNLTGSFLVGQAVARRMAARGRGSIVLVSSVTGEVATSGRTAYAASKGGVVMLMKSMAVDLAPNGIRVNALAPGAFETGLAARHHAGDSAFIRAAYVGRTPLGRYGQPGELAPAAVFLASDEARYITGAVLPVDGGYLAAGMLRPGGGRGADG